jgi:hypothetical protein
MQDMGKMFQGKQDAAKRVGGQVKRKLRTLFEQRYWSGKNRWFFTKLRF